MFKYNCVYFWIFVQSAMQDNTLYFYVKENNGNLRSLHTSTLSNVKSLDF